MKRPHLIAAFSLIELLIVVAVIGLLGSLAATALSGTTQSMKITGSAQTVADMLDTARNTAAARNVPVEVRFYKLAEPNGPGGVQYRGVRLFVLDKDVPTPLGRGHILASPIRDQRAVSSLLAIEDENVHRGSGDFNNAQSGSYFSFRYRPNGATDLNPTNSWFLTLASATDSGVGLPKNFATISIHPISGKATIYQPR